MLKIRKEQVDELNRAEKDGKSTSPCPLERGILRVKAVDKCTNAPIPAASVEVDSRKGATDSSGFAVFADLPAKSHHVDVEKTYMDYLRFISHYPRVVTHHTAQVTGSAEAKVTPDSTTDVVVKLTVFRLVVLIEFNRRHIDLNGSDKFGHWWVKIDGVESYGWWPKRKVGSRATEPPPPTPPARPPPLPADATMKQRVQQMAATAKYQAELRVYEAQVKYQRSIAPHLRRLSDTFGGMEGELNAAFFGGTPTRDPHHTDTKYEESYQPIVDDCRTDPSIKQSIRDFAKSYASTHHVWSWRFEGGDNCHSFQKEMIANCKLTYFSQLR